MLKVPVVIVIGDVWYAEFRMAAPTVHGLLAQTRVVLLFKTRLSQQGVGFTSSIAGRRIG